MKYTIKVQGASDDIILERTWWGYVRIEQASKPLSKLKEKYSPFVVKAGGGKEHKLVIKAHFLDPVPAVFLDGAEVLLARKLHAVESVFAFLPIGMFIGYGIPATFLGILVISINFNILRSKLPSTLKWMLIYFISLLTFLTFAFAVRSLGHH